MTRERMRWTHFQRDRLRHLWAVDLRAKTIANIMGTTTNAIIGEARRLDLPKRKTGRRPMEGGPKALERDMSGQRRFKSAKATGKPAHDLAIDNPAVIEGRSVFPTRVFAPHEIKPIASGLRLFKSGVNSRKTGKTVEKGRMEGFPIYTLTLEERKTCPRTCSTWSTCYGSSMQYAQRIRHGAELEAMILVELSMIQRMHPGGFLVRLHVLGDFYSVRYVRLWRDAIDAFPALHIWGYTARPPRSRIGSEIMKLATERWDRFAVRFSGADLPEMASFVVRDVAKAASLVCPMQVRAKPECCAKCAICWQSKTNITFLMH